MVALSDRCNRLAGWLVGFCALIGLIGLRVCKFFGCNGLSTSWWGSVRRCAGANPFEEEKRVDGEIDVTIMIMIMIMIICI